VLVSMIVGTWLEDTRGAFFTDGDGNVTGEFRTGPPPDDPKG